MNSIDVLTRQHRFLEELFAKHSQSEGDDKLLVLGRITEILLIHCILEEQYFYPVTRRHGLAESIDRSVDEHREVRQIIGEIVRLRPGDGRLDGLVAKLEESVKRHVFIEETVVFPRARTRVDPHTLDTIGKGMGDAIVHLRRQSLHELLVHEISGFDQPTFI